MVTGLKLLRFLDVSYDLEHERIPGYFSVSCVLKEHGFRQKNASFTFQYDKKTGQVYFRPYPERVQLPIGVARSREDAAEQAKKFLKLWLEDLDFHMRKSAEIEQLWAEKKAGRS